MVLDDEFHELPWWGPRPSALQRWVLSDGQEFAKLDRYREARRWYARDRARTTLKELVMLPERTSLSYAA